MAELPRYAAEMPTYDQPDKREVDDLSRLVSQIAAVPTESMLRDDLNLNEFCHAHRLQELYRILAQVGIGVLPPAQMQQLTLHATAAYQLLKEVQTYNPQQGPGARLELARRAREQYEAQFELLSSCIALFQVQAGGLERFRRAAAEAQQFMDSVKVQGQSALEELKSSIAAGERELRNSIEVAKQAAETSALSTYATYFDQESNSHKSSALRWLVATVALFAFRAWLAYWFWSQFGEALNKPDSLTTFQSVQLAITKIVILSVLFTVSVASSKIYRSHLHNLVINRHRRNALPTFQAFVNAPEADAQTKNAVLLEATKCDGWLSCSGRAVTCPRVRTSGRGR